MTLNGCVQGGTLAPNATLTCLATHTATQADIDNGSYSNTASVIGVPPAGNGLANATATSNTETVPAESTNGIALAQTASPSSYSKAGDVITYDITVANTGTVAFSNVTLSLTNPQTQLGNCTPSALPGALNAGTTTVCKATHTVTQADLDAGQYVNTASATGTTPASTVLITTPSVMTTPAITSGALTITKTAKVPTYDAVGDAVPFDIAVTNTGTVTLSNVAVSDPTAALSAGCSAAALAPQESIACTATHTATQADLTAGSYTNTASATGKSPSGTAVPVAQASATVNATLTGGITLSETVTPATYSDSGQTLTFTIAARNTGNVPLTGLELTSANATLGSCAPVAAGGTLQPGASTICTATRVTAARLTCRLRALRTRSPHQARSTGLLSPRRPRPSRASPIKRPGKRSRTSSAAGSISSPQTMPTMPGACNASMAKAAMEICRSR